MPLISYGGSSLITIAIAVGLILRIDFETRAFLNQERVTVKNNKKKLKKKADVPSKIIKVEDEQ